MYNLLFALFILQDEKFISLPTGGRWHGESRDGRSLRYFRFTIFYYLRILLHRFAEPPPGGSLTMVKFFYRHFISIKYLKLNYHKLNIFHFNRFHQFFDLLHTRQRCSGQLYLGTRRG